MSLEVKGSSINHNIGTGEWTKVFWKLGTTNIGNCGAQGSVIDEDLFDTWVDVPGFSCADPGATQSQGTYEVRAITCELVDFCFPGEQVRTFSFVLDGPTIAQELCKTPPTQDCDDCKSCFGAGAGCAIGAPQGERKCTTDAGGTNVALRYRAGGVGHATFPGSSAWNVTLGRYWSHEGAERIVVDPDDSHVWLLTRNAVFREFTDTNADDVYDQVSPSDEYRTLTRTPSGWELLDLDGTVQYFENAAGGGRWTATVDRNGNATTGAYDASDRLASIEFPDGRREDFAYDPTTSKLADVTQTGVDGVTTRVWTYTWTGLDLTRIDLPDGRAWKFLYGDPANPGHMTRKILVGTDSSERIEQAWEYDTNGDIFRTWRGAATATDPAAVDLWSIDFVSATQSDLTDPLGDTATYLYEQDPASDKIRVTQILGDCPGCGVAPNSSFEYDDPANPLRPTQETDGEGHVKAYTYDSHGMMTVRTEAVGTPLERATTFAYDPTYPALVVSTTQESVEGGSDVRETLIGRDPNGDPLTTTIEGFEATVAFSYQTGQAFNAAGQPLTINPPGYGTSDVTGYTYDPTRGNLLPLTRTDPIIGATASTEYEYDPFNRTTKVTDPNGLETITQYDALGRVTLSKLADPGTSQELETSNSYTALGDLLRTTLPEGNVIQYGYDHAGRLISIDRKPNATTPGERTFYTLDDIGNRIQEDLQVWNVGANDYVTKSSTGYVYSTRCHLDKILHPGGSVTEYAYDCNGNLEKVWDANHPSSGQTAPPSQLYAYDELDRLESVAQPFLPSSAAVTSYEYDVQDHLVAVVDAEGNRTEYVYSDRDLLTKETSPVSGITDHVYNEHGELVETTDARDVVVTRAVDALDRVTLVDYPDDALNVSYGYDTGPEGLGRLVGITRHGETIAYGYDGFGRLVTDGALGYGYDDNGNRTTLAYPGGITASYSFDFADRELALAVDIGSGPVTVASQATYLPSGPLTGFVMGNGIVEQRTFDQRYFPVSIGAYDDPTSWVFDYDTDAVGNVLTLVRARYANCSPTEVHLTNATFSGSDTVFACEEITVDDSTVTPTGDVAFLAGSRVTLEEGFVIEPGGRITVDFVVIGPSVTADQTFYGYRDHQYFLTSEDAPAGSSAWAYDRIGNRLTNAAPFTGTDTYAYPINSAGGNVPVLDAIQLGVGGIADYSFGAAGHLAEVDRGANAVAFSVDQEGRHSSFTRSASGSPVAQVALSYDGRSFLRRADELASGTPTGYFVTPTYSSEGLLQSLLRQDSPTAPLERITIFYLAGRPLAQVRQLGATVGWTYFTTDHLGTPLYATDELAEEVWLGPLRPFGEDTGQGTPSGALDNGIFLRLPGQWEDELWADATSGADVFYNVHRWYEAGTGRYTRVDPLGLDEGPNLFLYVDARPTLFIDPLGLAQMCCRKLGGLGGLTIFRHCYFILNDGTRWGLYPERLYGRRFGVPRPNDMRRDKGGPCFECSPKCDNGSQDQCLRRAARNYPIGPYSELGTNSNTFAGNLADDCCAQGIPWRLYQRGETPGIGLDPPRREFASWPFKVP